jgi:hypothetical protein
MPVEVEQTNSFMHDMVGIEVKIWTLSYSFVQVLPVLTHNVIKDNDGPDVSEPT